MTVWGEATHGGYIPRALQPSSVASVVLGCRALAVLLTDGRVQSFGDAQWGGDTWWIRKSGEKVVSRIRNLGFFWLAFFRFCCVFGWREGGENGELERRWGEVMGRGLVEPKLSHCPTGERWCCCIYLTR